MCETYKEMKPQNLPEPLKQHSDGDEPWQKIGLDFFEIAGKHYFVVVGYYSNFIDIDLMTTMTSACTVTSLKKYCAHYGIPRMIVLDGGPQFSSQEFKLFVDNWGITHITSSPMHQRVNGGAESAVKIMKTLLVKHARKEVTHVKRC
ncbi:PREDICTED: endogenous retrovirus group K member 18 Pol protein-like [Acropora digitifera]|uniref:endogenous retrovirus group K member 18 Pol protein-like n=1 Tax=Acropora digitifera TaxID=70779 RepID=UPI00077A514C|nr:PREDICTED: endogenous retrovirus group K member 18 Pol protein-like [Acropora digitifera]